MKFHQKGCLITFILSGISFGITLFLSLALKDSLIIQFGLRMTKTLIGLFRAFGFGCMGMFLYHLFAYLHLKKKVNKVMEQEAERLSLEEERKKKEDGTLSVFGDLSDEYVLKETSRQGLSKWNCLKPEIEILTDQMVLMNSYQDRLSKLLINNEAQSLCEAEELVSKMEQQILLNVRKVLNYMEIFDVPDREKMKECILQCAKENTGLLNATKDFLLCVTNFLNNQGNYAEDGMQMVEDFKKVLDSNI